MGQCMKTAAPKHKKGNLSKSPVIGTKKLASSFAINYESGDSNQISTLPYHQSLSSENPKSLSLKESKKNVTNVSRFEQALKDGQENDLELLEKCQSIRKPTIFVYKEAKPLYSTQNQLLELLNTRHFNTDFDLNKSFKIPPKHNNQKKRPKVNKGTRNLNSQLKSMSKSKPTKNDKLLNKMNTILSSAKKTRKFRKRNKLNRNYYTLKFSKNRKLNQHMNYLLH